MEIPTTSNLNNVVQPILSKSKEFNTFLQSSIEDAGLVRKFVSKPLVWLDADENILNAFDKLSNQKLLSAPIYCSISRQWVSILDIKDLVKFVVSLFDDNNNLVKDINPKDITIRTILTNSNGVFKRQCPMISKNDTILNLLDLFNKKFHRVCIALSDEQMDIKVYSQLTLIKWLDKHLKELGLFNKLKPVIQINHNKLAIDAFRLLAENNIYGVPIVSDNGELMDNISVIDIKYVKMDKAKLLQPLSEFFYPTVGNAYPIPLREPIVCAPQTRLREAIGRVASGKVHRIFLVKEVVDAGVSQVPINVVSVSDIVGCVVNLTGLKSNLPKQ
ncbi:hypothetical protein DICPUDRAFT_159488 [Dictyostelium purpureum]|uniref:CBS domain-containing protein n=1 Tax=Dictyostelium purpureum TaxID=5786 RepID=F1A491_DICPU|nr:uncharacterized protein DICPUDRAFT_159488 [Dictyostelium purpureum]EGC28990.1 hypothetical protein DICPUDRAFT_159488 [Dictyostelium purpureum]|eukprot:XP_003294487.1 hypothetical protein DICPUDRAFT_159488 [Dictyostelium purpureum]